MNFDALNDFVLNETSIGLVGGVTMPIAIVQSAEDGAAIVAPAATLDGFLDNADTFGAVTAPSHTSAGILLAGRTGSAALTGPAHTATGEEVEEVAGDLTGAVQVSQQILFSGQGVNGTISSGRAVGPRHRAEGFYAGEAALIAPSHTAAGSLQAGNQAAAAVIMASPLVLANDAGINVGTAALVQRMSRVDASGFTGKAGFANLIQRMAVVQGEASAGRDGVAALVQPMALVQSLGPAGSVITGAVEARSAVVLGEMLGALADYVGWCLNVEVPEVTRYVGVPYRLLGQLGDKYLAVTDEGIFVLEGDTDAGQDIDAAIRFGYTDFQSELLKRVPVIYVGGKLRGQVNLLVSVDGEEVEHVYPHQPVVQELEAHKVKIGRGLKSRYWQFGLENANGADFEIDVFDFAESVLNRRVG